MKWMTDNPFLQPLHITLRPSGTILAVALLAHAGAVGGLFQSALPSWLQWLLTAVVAASLLRMLHMYILPGRDQPRRLVLDSDDSWQVIDADGRALQASLCRDALIHPALIALRLRTTAGTRRILLTPDNADAATLRRLRVRLRGMDGRIQGTAPREWQGN